jgi:hypothetical protein
VETWLARFGPTDRNPVGPDPRDRIWSLNQGISADFLRHLRGAVAGSETAEIKRLTKLNE